MNEPHTQLHRNAAILRVSDTGAMEELKQLVTLDEFALAWLSDTELVLDPTRIGELQQLLAERGWPPLVRRLRTDDTPGPAPAT